MPYCFNSLLSLFYFINTHNYSTTTSKYSNSILIKKTRKIKKMTHLKDVDFISRIKKK